MPTLAQQLAEEVVRIEPDGPGGLGLFLSLIEGDERAIVIESETDTKGGRENLADEKRLAVAALVPILEEFGRRIMASEQTHARLLATAEEREAVLVHLRAFAESARFGPRMPGEVAEGLAGAIEGGFHLRTAREATDEQRARWLGTKAGG